MTPTLIVVPSKPGELASDFGDVDPAAVPAADGAVVDALLLLVLPQAVASRPNAATPVSRRLRLRCRFMAGSFGGFVLSKKGQ
jgi:hypothetical protein